MENLKCKTSLAKKKNSAGRRKTEFQVGPWQVGECGKLGCKKLAALSALACDQKVREKNRGYRVRVQRREADGRWESVTGSLKVKMICIKLATVTRMLKV